MFHLPFNSTPYVKTRFLPNLFPKLYCQAKPSSSVVEYLQSSLGLTPESAQTFSLKLKKRNPRNPDAVITFFKSHGLSATHIASIFNKVPLLLCYTSPESKLAPKIQFFKDKSVSESDLLDLLVTNPHIFVCSIEGYIQPVFDLLYSILGANELVVKFLIQAKVKYHPPTLSTNLNILRNCGVQNDHIAKEVIKKPWALHVNPDHFNETVENIKGMGSKPQSYSFVRAVFTIASLSREKWDAKVNFFESLGWSVEEVLALFLKQPNCIRLSEEKVRKNFDYLTKELGWDHSYILIYPTLLLLSLEKRIIPRYRFLCFLVSKGLIPNDKIVGNSFTLSEKRFLGNFVARYESKVPDIVKIYEDLVGS